MKSLEQLVRETEEVLAEKWRERDRAKTLPGPKDERRREATAHLNQIIPPAMRAPRGELVKRVSVTNLIVAASTWKWDDGNLMFRGLTEIGKTTAATLLIRRLLSDAVQAGGELFRRALSIRFLNARELSASERQHKYGAGEAPDVMTAKHASFLVLDDLGTECDPTVLSSVLDWRYLHKLPTCVTTGLAQPQLTEYFGSALYRRMLEQGGKRALIVESFNKPVARR
jgi:DNA replication protein DnaC